MFRLSKRERLGPTVRDRLGMVCAVGAVACLGSLMVHRSHPYPVQRSDWEQELFRDLVESHSPEADAKLPGNEFLAPAQSPDVATSIALGAEVPRPLMAADVYSIAAEPAVPHPFSTLVAKPIYQRPAAERPRFILPIKHEEPTATGSVWLSGDIEIPANQPAPESESPVTLFYLPIDSD